MLPIREGRQPPGWSACALRGAERRGAYAARKIDTTRRHGRHCSLQGCSAVQQVEAGGGEVHVIMTASATQFISELTFQTLSRQPVYTDTFDERDASVVSHIDLADHADLVLVAPATANVIGKMAHGLADDMLTTTLLATTAPVMVAPAMNVHMYAHPAVMHNMDILRSRGVGSLSGRGAPRLRL